MSWQSASDVISRRFPSVFSLLQTTVPAANLPDIPHDLVRLWVASALKAPQANALYVLSGLGAHAWAVLSRLHPSASLVIYEASPARLSATLHTADYSALLSDARVHLFCGPCEVGEFERLHQLPVARISDVVPLRFSPAWSLDEAAYAAFYTEFARQLEVVRRLHLTNIHDSLFWQATTLQNLPSHITAPDVGCLAGVFRGVPLVLVGAGPSLDESEEFLRSAATRAIIVAVNSSYRKLRRIGVCPHLVLAADPRLDTYRGIQGQVVDDGPYLVAPFIVNPGVVQAFHGRAFSWSGDNSRLVSTIRTRLGFSAGTAILEKGTVSLAVADLARHMGVTDIILVGQDMAIRPDGLTHTQESIYTHTPLQPAPDGTLVWPDGRTVRMVAGNTAAQVPTLEAFYVYLKAFEQWVAAHPTVRMYNTAALGARIAGATYTTYTQAIQLLSSTPLSITSTLDTLHRAAPETSVTPSALLQALQPTLRFARTLYNRALGGAIALDTLPARYFQPSYATHSALRDIQQTSVAINDLLDKNPQDYAILLDGGLKRTLLDWQKQVQTLDADSDFARQLLQNKEFFWALSSGVEPTLSLLDSLCTRLTQAPIAV